MTTLKFIKPLLFSICIVTFGKVQAQDIFYAHIGYNAAVLKSEGLDFVVDRYNETRAYLTEPMPYPHYYDGLTLHVGGASSAFMYDFGLTYRSNVVSATGIDATGFEVQRDLKNKWNTFDVGLGVCVGGNEQFALMIGVNSAINSEKALTRADYPEDIGKANFEKVNSQFKIGFEPFVQMIVTNENGVGLLFKPYYSWSPILTEYTELNSYINPYTYVGDPYPIEGRLTGFGLSVSLVRYDYSN